LGPKHCPCGGGSRVTGMCADTGWINPRLGVKPSEHRGRGLPPAVPVDRLKGRVGWAARMPV